MTYFNPLQRLTHRQVAQVIPMEWTNPKKKNLMMYSVTKYHRPPPPTREENGYGKDSYPRSPRTIFADSSGDFDGVSHPLVGSELGE